MKFVFEFQKSFQYRWLTVVQDDVYLRLNDFLAAMQALEPPQNKLLAVPTQQTGGLQLSAPEIFVMSRDVVVILSSTELMARLTGRGTLADVLSRWVAALGLEIL